VSAARGEGTQCHAALVKGKKERRHRGTAGENSTKAGKRKKSLTPGRCEGGVPGPLKSEEILKRSPHQTPDQERSPVPPQVELKLGSEDREQQKREFSVKSMNLLSG